ncbi:cbb3-type cytochrome oxidase assembly protein CcoS [Tropicimonas isoalkanivorans]|uniref:Cytochrome oxidase maturation protein, cbb3-type n=1 Tax=Tropicimonas isoalkanivorans TaxID=441112 RepID=A0A1I1R2X3_9RHOB|nr:cbb3-type cytochrome oxidase assembly protein CcoS [Tropicimonas isoalkanivorans]SFD24610.1 cytochrome oxidase maturation protein, cbb3-type [Tropicimonas isoalkanivorans]
MEVLAFLIPISLFLGGVGLAAFFWAVRTDQYDDPEGDSRRILSDEYDDTPKESRKTRDR